MPSEVTDWGALVLGAVLMFISMMFIRRHIQVDKRATPATLTKFVAILLTGAVPTFLTKQMGADSIAFGWYAIGVGVGLVVWAAFYTIGERIPPYKLLSPNGGSDERSHGVAG